MRRLGPFLGVQNFIFEYFGGVYCQKDKYFCGLGWGYDETVDIFRR